MTDAETIEKLSRLFEPMGGISEGTIQFRPSTRLSESFQMFTATTGNVGFIAPETMAARKLDGEGDIVGGAGSDLDEAKGKIRAQAECVERYANFIFLRSEIVVDTAERLGSRAMDLDTLPRCSESEYRNPVCPMVPPSKTERIRWVPALSLHTGEEKLVPLICSHLLHRPWRAEMFVNSISTGVAAHFSPEKALLNAICEVVERDAIASLWLGKLPVKRFIPTTEQLADWGLDQESAIETLFFDVTLDCHVRSVYILQLCDNHPYASQVVGCATDFSLESACRKVVRETLCYRSKFEHHIAIPDRFEDFVRLQDGAVYMGRPENREAFRFLIDAEVSVPPPDRDDAKDDAERLRHVSAALQAIGADVFVVDLTTDELRDVGLWVMRAIIPQLMPMSPVYRARFLGSPRLYQLAERLGLSGFTEADVNIHPQPFA